MVTLSGLHIGGDRLVAVEAKRRLRRAFPARMALAALMFGLGVSGDDRAWHKGGFEGLCLRRAKHQ